MREGFRSNGHRKYDWAVVGSPWGRTRNFRGTVRLLCRSRRRHWKKRSFQRVINHRKRRTESDWSGKKCDQGPHMQSREFEHAIKREHNRSPRRSAKRESPQPQRPKPILEAVKSSDVQWWQKKVWRFLGPLYKSSRRVNGASKFEDGKAATMPHRERLGSHPWSRSPRPRVRGGQRDIKNKVWRYAPASASLLGSTRTGATNKK